jgi:hypothetical protein
MKALNSVPLSEELDIILQDKPVVLLDLKWSRRTLGEPPGRTCLRADQVPDSLASTRSSATAASQDTMQGIEELELHVVHSCR